MIYAAYGLLVDSEIELPITIGATGSANADVQVRIGTVDTSTVVFTPVDEDDEAYWVTQGWAPGRAVVQFPDLVAQLSIGPAHIIIDPVHTDDADYIAHLVLDHVIPRWLALRGELVLHSGSVVAPSGLAVAFVGTTGMGKSSTVTGLASAGWRLLGDDACRLVATADGWRATPAYPGVRLTANSREALVPDLTSHPMSSGSDKHRVILDVPRLGGPAPLALIVELGDTSERPAMRRLTLSEATATLCRHSFSLASSQAEVALRAFQLSSAVAIDVPCVRLDFRRSWDVYPEVINVLDPLLAMP